MTELFPLAAIAVDSPRLRWLKAKGWKLWNEEKV
jgi:hypothetical protein